MCPGITAHLPFVSSENCFDSCCVCDRVPSEPGKSRKPGKYRIGKNREKNREKQDNHENRQSPGKKKKQDQEKNLAKLLIKIMPNLYFSFTP